MDEKTEQEPVRVFLIADPDDYGVIPVVELTSDILKILIDAGVDFDEPRR